MQKIVGITYDVKTDWQRGSDEPVDANAEFDKPQTIDKICQAIEAGGHTVRRIGNVKALLAKIDPARMNGNQGQALRNLDVDIVFNICEGVAGRNRESQVPNILEMYGIPFVGADALTLGLTLDKVMAKKIFLSENIPTPRFFSAWKTDDLEKINSIGYPLIVKSRYEGTSKGISKDSRVEDLEGLKRQVSVINDEYNQPALVEEFIRGTEFTVPVIGNRNAQAMPIVQVTINGQKDLGDEFFTFERVSGESVQYVCPAPVPQDLARCMQELAVRAYKCVECRDVGRVDFRVDEKGTPYVLEINPLPSFDQRDVFNVFPQTMGSTYNETINKILNHALKRYDLNGHKQ